jgi:NitT/TauT family transport system substrate-binding protein
MIITNQIFRRMCNILLCLIMAGCGSAPTATTEPPTSLSVQLAWIHEYSSAFFYAAELNGHFAEQNLQATLEPGGFVDGVYIEPIDQVVSGEFDFGTASASSLLQARADGKPVVAIASIYQRSPSAIISLADSGINQPQDLIGKTVSAAEGGAQNLLRTMLISQNIDPEQVNIVPRQDFGIDPLIDGEVDALVGWIINEGVLVREAGAEPSFMLLSDYGILDYNTLIFTTEDTITQRPQVVERFLRAIFAGLDDMIADPEQAAEYTLRYNDQLTLEGQISRVQASVPLIQPANADLGMMDVESWNSIYTVFREADILTAEVDLATVYNMTFLNTIYSP